MDSHVSGAAMPYFGVPVIEIGGKWYIYNPEPFRIICAIGAIALGTPPDADAGGKE